MNEKALCLIAYVFSLPGALIVRAAGGKSNFCLHHVRRSLELFLFIFFLFVLWIVLSYVLMFVPYLGFPLAMGMFGIAMAGIIFDLALGIKGIISVFKGKMIVFPLISSLMTRIEPLFRVIGLREEKVLL